MMTKKSYNILKVEDKSETFKSDDFWKNIPLLKIEDYLWLENNYKPRVEAKLCYNNKNIFVRFISFENEITARFTKINDPVHKDSCVEFFINPFPSKTINYINFEINPLGTIYVGFGNQVNRSNVSAEEIKLIEIYSTVKTPVVGEYGNTHWEVIYRIPFPLIEKYFGLRFDGSAAKGNLLKCGDEAKFEHYGVWNNINSEKPNFHLPKYFGDLIFVK